MAQVLLNGVVNGLGIALLAVAFSLVYLPTKVFHIALGGVYAISPYIALAGMRIGLHPSVCICAGVLLAVLLSLVCEWANHSRLQRRMASSGAHFVGSLGLYIVIVEVVALLWGNESQTLRVGVDRTCRFGSMVLTRGQLVAAVVSAGLLATGYIWLRFSNLGIRFRALADNPVEFALQGYNVDVYRLLAFALSGFLGGVAALLSAYDVGFDPHVGLPSLLLAVVAVIIGGRGSFLGPILGGLMLGALRSQVLWFMSARWQDVMTFMLLALFLYVCPNGVCSQTTRLEGEA